MSFIKCENINLIFHVQKERKIKDILIPGSKRFNTFQRDGSVHAIKNLTLDVLDGDRMAIIGHNGAGKSTLLKMIAGIYPPTSGTLKTEGRISSMFELATGFEMESTGWDNIYLRGLMLGATPAEIQAKMAEIAEFSELGSFLNMPVKYYSSGMFMRLAFSISTTIQPDILLLDEVIAAGDASFLEKAKARMQEMVSISKITVFVRHSMSSAVEMCNRCIWMERGEIRAIGTPCEVTREYIKQAHLSE